MFLYVASEKEVKKDKIGVSGKPGDKHILAYLNIKGVK